VPDGLVCAVALHSPDATPIVITPIDGQIKWSAPPPRPQAMQATGKVTFIMHIF